LIPSPFTRIPSPVKVYTLLTTSNRFALPGFVKACKALNTTGVTVFAMPQSFSPDPETSTRISQQISDLTRKESDAASQRDYVLASQIRGDITSLEGQIKELQEQASAYYVQETTPIKDILATVVLDREAWEGDDPVTEEFFPNQITHISTKLLSTGIRNQKHVTPLHKRTYIPLGSLEFSPSQLVAQVAVVPMAMDSVVGDVSQSETPPSGLQAADDYLVDLLEPETTSNDGIPNSLSPNQRSFVEAILKKEASNFAQASNVAGLSPSSTKKVVTDITKKWPEFPQFISAYIKIENEPQTLEEV
jgi:lambda repressor-like predicted transcriptional regulator